MTTIEPQVAILHLVLPKSPKSSRAKTCSFAEYSALTLDIFEMPQNGRYDKRPLSRIEPLKGRRRPTSCHR